MGVESRQVAVILLFTPIPTFPLKGEGEFYFRIVNVRRNSIKAMRAFTDSVP